MTRRLLGWNLARNFGPSQKIGCEGPYAFDPDNNFRQPIRFKKMVKAKYLSTLHLSVYCIYKLSDYFSLSLLVKNKKTRNKLSR